MYEYVALVWASEDKKSAHHALKLAEPLHHPGSNWQLVYRSMGLVVFHASETLAATEAYSLEKGAGVILGKLFSKARQGEEPQPRVTVDEHFSKAVLESRGQHLVESCWGRYVAFLWDHVKQRHYVLCDPTGGIRCIYTEISGVHVFMSDMAAYVELGGAERRVNWRFLTALFWNLRLISNETGFSGVSQLYAAERVTIERGGISRSSFTWSPKRVCEERPALENVVEARSALKAAVQRSVAAWASCYPSIVHRLSGGLDSSIVAVCLSAARTRTSIVCVTLSTEGPEGDERYFARLAAARAGLPLKESKWVARNQRLDELLDKGRHFSPMGLYSETDRVLEGLVRGRQCTGIFSGQGGDHLFHQHRSRFVAAEYLSRHGLKPGFLKVLADTSRLTCTSLWQVLSVSLTYGSFRRSYNPNSVYELSSLLSEEARATFSAELFLHPWIADLTGLPASTAERIGLLVDSQHFFLRGVPFADTVHPLLSEPVIECCLRIPSYVLTQRGVRRALVRDAFRSELPPEIANRITKGGTTNYLNRLVVENIAFLREFLIGGLLVRSRLLDKRVLERELTESVLVRGANLPDILLAARMEAWLRGWKEVWPTCAS